MSRRYRPQSRSAGEWDGLAAAGLHSFLPGSDLFTHQLCFQAPHGGGRGYGVHPTQEGDMTECVSTFHRVVIALQVGDREEINNGNRLEKFPLACQSSQAEMQTIFRQSLP